MPPRKSLAKLLWGLYAAFIVYGTAFPFRFILDAGYLRERLGGINWFPLIIPPGHQALYPDYLQNILLFIPFGFLGYVAIADKRAAWKPPFLVALGCLFSASVEFLQLFSLSRFTALTDVIWNTLGTALGVWGGLRLRSALLDMGAHPTLRRLLDADAAFPTLLFGLAAAAGAWQPFDFALEGEGFLRARLAAFFATPFPAFVPDDLLPLSRFACFSLFACRLFAEAGAPGGRLGGAVAAWLCGLGLELGQLLVQSRGPELRDLFVYTLGVALGYYGAHTTFFHRRPRAWGLAVTGIFLAAIALKNLHPYHFAGPEGRFNWIPFLPYYRETSFTALSDFLQEGTAYFSVGVIGAYLFSGRATALWITTGLAVPFSLAIEVLQLSLPGRHADITHVVGAAAGVLAGHVAIARGWKMYREYFRFRPAAVKSAEG